MRRLRLTATACTVALALVAIAATSASAFVLPEVLGSNAEAKFSTKDTVANPIFKTVNGNEITCEHWEGEGGFETGSKTLGLFHIHFFGKCKSKVSGITASCTGLGDAAESILVLGKWHTVVDTKTGEALGAAILWLLEPVHFTCSILLVEITGSFMCLITTPLTSAATHTITCTQVNGVAQEKKYLNDAGMETTIAPLLLLINHNEDFEMGVGATGTLTFPTAVTIDD
jgi:hypothetical protein